jgi:hypothetical protein
MRWSFPALTAALLAVVATAPAWADHGVGLRSERWSPITAALVFGGLALLAGAVVVLVVAILTRRRHSPSE